MQAQNKKVIYYYYDEEGNRRPVNIQYNDGYDLMIDQRFIEMTLERHPHLKNNFYGNRNHKRKEFLNNFFKNKNKAGRSGSRL